jgi:intersectin
LVVIEGQDLNIDLNDEEKFAIKRAFCEVKISGQKFATHCIENTQNPKWNTAMQFQIYDLNKEILTLNLYDKKLFTPNVMLGKTHISISNIYKEQLYDNSPVTRVFRLADTKSGKVMVKMNISIYKK